MSATHSLLGPSTVKSRFTRSGARCAPGCRIVVRVLYPASRLLNLSRSSLYYDAVAPGVRDLELMRLIDEIHLKWPFFGSRRIRDELNDLGHVVGRGHVGTLMRKMGIEAIYCKPRTTRPQPGNKTYPYLLRNMEIIRANHVWAADTLAPALQVQVSPICRWPEGSVI